MKLALLDTLNEGIEMLEKRGFEDARLCCEELLSRTLGKPRFSIYADGEQEIPCETRSQFLKLVRKRSKHEPLQYLIGETSFRSARLRIQKGTLIPRPETEVLTGVAISKIKAKNLLKPRILDVGTGSGCIAISLAQELGDCEIGATDISARSLELAKTNAELNQVHQKIRFFRTRYWQQIPKTFDVIISNPPYLSKADFENLQPELEFEPKRALYGGPDGLNAYRYIIAHAQEVLIEEGCILFEVGIHQAQIVADLLSDHGFKSIEIEKDLSGIERVVSAILKG